MHITQFAGGPQVVYTLPAATGPAGAIQQVFVQTAAGSAAAPQQASPASAPAAAVQQQQQAQPSLEDKKQRLLALQRQQQAIFREKAELEQEMRHDALVQQQQQVVAQQQPVVVAPPQSTSPSLFEPLARDLDDDSPQRSAAGAGGAGAGDPFDAKGASRYSESRDMPSLLSASGAIRDDSVCLDGDDKGGASLWTGGDEMSSMSMPSRQTSTSTALSSAFSMGSLHVGNLQSSFLSSLPNMQAAAAAAVLPPRQLSTSFGLPPRQLSTSLGMPPRQLSLQSVSSTGSQPRSNTLRVSGQTPISRLAGSVAKRIRTAGVAGGGADGTLTVEAMGPASVAQALRGLKLAAVFLAEDGLQVTGFPFFIHSKGGAAGGGADAAAEVPASKAAAAAAAAAAATTEGGVPSQKLYSPGVRFELTGGPLSDAAAVLPSSKRLRVTTASDPGKTAGAIAKLCRGPGRPELAPFTVFCGPSPLSINIAAKAVALARFMLEPDSLDVYMQMVPQEAGSSKMSRVEDEPLTLLLTPVRASVKEWM